MKSSDVLRRVRQIRDAAEAGLVPGADRLDALEWVAAFAGDLADELMSAEVALRGKVHGTTGQRLSGAKS